MRRTILALLLSAPAAQALAQEVPCEYCFKHHDDGAPVNDSCTTTTVLFTFEENGDCKWRGSPGLQSCTMDSPCVFSVEITVVTNVACEGQGITYTMTLCTQLVGKDGAPQGGITCYGSTPPSPGMSTTIANHPVPCGQKLMLRLVRDNGNQQSSIIGEPSGRCTACTAVAPPEGH